MVTTVLMLTVFMAPVQLERPHLTIAHGFVESKLNSKAVGSHGEKGAWQVLEKYWGKVPRDLSKQAQQSEKILNAIQKNKHCSLFKSLVLYNGNGRRSKKYAHEVVRRTIELAMVVMPEKSNFDPLRSYE